MNDKFKCLKANQPAQGGIDKKIEDVEEIEEGSGKEYIFLIDRSYSMHDTIGLAREALILFLLSLPAGCKFNICSYGSKFEFLFKDQRSVDYDDDSCQSAIALVRDFDANFGGTDIYNPLKQIFDMQTDCTKTNVFLLTDGAVYNTN